jgi:hypothetical protein
MATRNAPILSVNYDIFGAQESSLSTIDSMPLDGPANSTFASLLLPLD